MLEIPLLLIPVALIVNIVQQPLPHHEIGGEVVDIQPRRIQQAAHLPDLLQKLRTHPVPAHIVQNRISGDVLLQNMLRLHVRRQQAGHPDARLRQPPVVVQLRGHLVPELVVAAGLVVDLLEDILPRPVRDKIGIAPLALPQQLFYGVGRAVDG